ncbi:benzoate/H(+) symporter BenE family transporter [Salinisphaera hydrothermalis]|uniref:Benzoate transporter n=1 Tax=Salinisphaera hydrothermalis (strain C41B8) TaxID=1304275 RepID=A0A084INZ1_SALHC|nr:benzoate/H(+) symporter BenE family transporter [Salinisphaera hydrothermalis]KEZ78425.1 benzoate transporter [Salinisphaera hydrothermalis C41B8]
MRPRFSLTDVLPPTVAGFVAVLVGYTGAAIIVVKAFEAAGASPSVVGSWMTVLGWSMAASTLALSLTYRQPILTAWSTPGAALLVVGLHGHSLGEAVTAFMLCGVLTLICGLTGAFARLMAHVPRSLASAMLAGVLLEFGLDAFTTGQHDGWIMAAALTAWLLGRRLIPRYAMLGMLVAGAMAAFFDGQLGAVGFHGVMATPKAVAPVFSVSALLGIGVPLFVVTMASQNAPGVAMLENAGYRPPVSMALVVTGAMTLLLAPVGGFVICLAAITAGICLTDEAHEDPERRYLATVFASLAYTVAGVFGGSIVTGLQALPDALIAMLAGLALLPAIASSLASAMNTADERDAATLTFLVTGSGLHIAGIGAPFWGLVVGALALWIWRSPRRSGAVGRSALRRMQRRAKSV